MLRVIGIGVVVIAIIGIGIRIVVIIGINILIIDFGIVGIDCDCNFTEPFVGVWLIHFFGGDDVFNANALSVVIA